MKTKIQRPKKTNFFYIDESGAINNDSTIFIHGCIKTDSPNTIFEALEKLKKELINNIYYQEFSSRILKEGFHATENNIDMRADVYKLLPLLDFRAYFVIWNKKTDYYEKIRVKEEHQIFTQSLKTLLMDRINGNKGDKNFFYFETIQIAKKSLETIVSEIFNSLDDGHDCKYEIVGKEEINLGVIDYLNYIFYHILCGEVVMKRMEQNFALLAPKIAVVKIQHNNVFLGRKKKPIHNVTLKNLKREFGGVQGN